MLPCLYKKNKSEYRTKGFTLVEVIVVLVIAAILLGVGGLSIANYVHTQKFRRQNEYAQSLFIAAQTSLTHMKATGELSQFANDVYASGDAVELNSANSYMGVTLPDYSTGEDRIWSIMKTADDTSDDNLVNRLLRDYIFDRGILSAAIAVELDPSDGIVTAVLYSDAAQTLSYTSGGKTPITDREKSVRSKNMVGFWYADSLSDAAPGVLEKPKIKDLALVNDETLHLDWRLSNVALSSIFTYEIRVYDASLSSDTPVMTITAPGTTLAEWSKGEKIMLSVKTASQTADMPFFVRYEDKKSSADYGMISLILDAVDLADINIDGTLKDEGLNLSFKRFGIDAENIYVRMQASAEGYKSSTWKESGRENAYFAALKTSDDGSQYSVANMRHFSNIRFSEARADAKYCYIQTSDLIWSGEESILEHNNVFDGCREIKDYETVAEHKLFPPVSLLGKASSYSSGEKKLSIDGLIIDTAIDEGSTASAGLFLKVEGEISSLEIKDADVSGGQAVGIVCAELDGEISDITVSGRAEGTLNVGGVVGYCSKNGSIEKITSSALVFFDEGVENIGGIVGRSEGDIANSTSIMLYEQADIDKLLGHGENVGGIVGYNAGTLEKCKVGSATEMGYVIGGVSVGGIIGIQGEIDKAMTLSGEGSSSRAYCFGKSNVGGIIGYVPEKLTLDGWLSQSVAAASESYCGGVAGYNAGTVRDCPVNVSNSSLYVETVAKYGAMADYVGGAVGYNCGILSSASSCSVIAAVAGHNYVGGVVGFNTVSDLSGNKASGETSISGWKLSGGYISGKNFVGGFIGLNLADDIFGSVITVKPNSVKGSNFIGGVIGGNIIVTKNNADPITAKLDCNNFLGSIAGEAYTGGYIGYGVMLKRTGNVDKIEDNVISLYLGTDVAAFDSLSAQQVVERISTLEISNGSTLNKNQDITFTLDGGTVRLAGISGVFYTGGAVGFMPEWNKSVIQNVICASPVTSTGAIVDTVNETINGNPVKFDYKISYVGGITGYVGKTMIVDSCSVANGMKITGAGTYCGGICEVNAGVIKNCTAANFGSQTKDNVGGIAGLNLYKVSETISGKIIACNVSGTVVGKGKVGGICVVNLATIDGENAKMTGRVTAFSSGCGGICAENYGSVRNYSFEAVSVTSKGDGAGGAVGYNLGTVSDTVTDAASSVSADKYAGGLIGICGKGGSVSGLVNNAAVSATSYVGGIIGSIEQSSAITVSDCENTGVVTAGAAYCGGIVSILPSGCKISNCWSTADITASSAASSVAPSGGICAENHGEISQSTVGGASVVTITGGNISGGITGVSDGTISGCTVTNIAVSDLKTSKTGGSVGGIVGINSGKISGCTVGDKTKNILLSAYYRGGSVGGVAGMNKAGGSVVAEAGKDFIIYAELSQPTGMFWIGGAVGINNGKIDGAEFAGAITGGNGSAYGCGGIAGDNSGSSAIISNCTISSSVNATGESGDIARVGGIAGVNENSAIVEYCSVSDGITVQTSYAWVGGIVGNNTSIVRNCKFAESTNTVKIISIMGDIGGIVGRNGIGGSIKDCSTGKNWSVTATDHGTDNTVAGICGYNSSSKNQSGLINYASVTKDVKGSSNVAAGIFGRLEIQGSNAWVISDCKNYGSISANDRVGGIIGQLKYCGGTIKNCENYGTVTARASSTGTGGIMACTYYMNSGDTLTISDCKNFGDINAPGAYGAGILGNVQRSESAVLIITDCVNTGNILSSTNRAGIIASIEKSPKSITLTRCRNYAKASGNFWGITAINNAGVKLTQCVNVPEISNPLAQNSNATKELNYRFVSRETRSGRYISYIKTAGAKNGNEAYRMADASLDTRWLFTSSKSAVSDDTAENRSFIITFGEKMSVSSIDILWYGTNRAYEYAIYYYNNDKSVDGKPVGGYELIYSADKTGIFSATANCVDNTVKSASLYTGNAFYDEFGKRIAVETKQFKIEVTSVKEGNSAKPYISVYDIIFKDSAGAALIDNTAGQLTSVIGNIACAEDISNATVTTQNGIGSDALVEKDGTAYIAVINNTNYMIKNLPYDPVTSSYTAKKIYDDIDARILEFYGNYTYNQTPAAPTELTISDEGGGIYQLGWNDDADAYSYSVQIYIDGKLINTNELASQNTLFISVDEANLNGVSKLYFKIVASGFNSDNKSDAAQSASVVLKKLLPQPKFHVELVNNSTDCISAVLDNPEDYGNDLGSIKIVVTSNGYSVGTIYPESGNKLSLISSPVNFTTGSSAPIVAQAIVKEGASISSSSSAKISYDAYVGGTTYYSGTSMIAASIKPDSNSIGWQGVSDDDLSYTMNLKASDNKEVYSRSEMLVYDEKLGVYTAVSSAVSRLSSTNAQFQPITLAGIPGSVLSSGRAITVRAYPWYTQNAMERFGYSVAENVDMTGLMSLYDKRKNNQPIYTVSGLDSDGNAVGAKLTDGYIIEYARDFSGNVIAGRYNVLYSVTIEYQNFMSRQLKSSDVNITQQPKPADITCKAENGVFTFSWDKDKNYSNAQYAVEIIGLTQSGARVTLYTSTTQNTNSVTITDKTWGYPSAEITVKRLGTLYPSGMTATLGAVATETLNITLPLDSIAEPGIVNTPLSGSGDAASDELRYLISWIPLTSKPVQRYTVYIADMIVDREADAAGFAAHTKWWSTDSALDNILLEKSASSMLIDIGETGFAPGKLYIWVIAEAHDNTAEGEIKYTDSQAEYIAEFELPKRLGTPNIPQFTPVYDAAAPVPMKTFKNDGVTMTVSGTSGENGRYVVEAYIYAEKPADGAVFGAGAPVFGLKRTSISNTLASGTFTFDKLETDWAGYWLTVRVRAVSDSEISSKWVYETVRLPKLKLDTASLSYADYQDSTQSTCIYPFLNTQSGVNIPLTRASVSFDEVEQADYYEITLGGNVYTVLPKNNTLGDQPYSFGSFIQKGIQSYSMSYSLASSVMYSNGRFTLILPNNMLEGGTALSLVYPNIAVRAVVDAARSERYADSDSSGQDFSGTAYTPLPDSVSVTGAQLAGDNTLTYAITTSISSCKLYLMDESGNVQLLVNAGGNYDLSEYTGKTVYLFARDASYRSLVTSALTLNVPVMPTAPIISALTITPDTEGYTISFSASCDPKYSLTVSDGFTLSENGLYTEYIAGDYAGKTITVTARATDTSTGLYAEASANAVYPALVKT